MILGHILSIFLSGANFKKRLLRQSKPLNYKFFIKGGEEK